jgi:hypothetical protein
MIRNIEGYAKSKSRGYPKLVVRASDLTPVSEPFPVSGCGR